MPFRRRFCAATAHSTSVVLNFGLWQTEEWQENSRHLEAALLGFDKQQQQQQTSPPSMVRTP